MLEIRELADQISVDIEQLRLDHADGMLRRKLLADILRKAHTVKGSAGTIGMQQTGRIAHEFENLLAAITAGRTRLGEDALDLMEETAALMLDSLTENVAEPTAKDLTERIKQLTHTRSEDFHVERYLELLPAEIRHALNENQKRHIAEVVAESKRLFIGAATFDVMDFDQELRRMKEQLDEVGDIISTHPSVDTAQPDRINFRLLFATSQSRPDTLPADGITFTELSTAGDVLQQTDPLPLTVRIDLNDLANLEDLTKELARASKKSLELAGGGEGNEERQTLALEVDRLSAAIEQKVESLRNTPATGILRRAERAGRAAARLTGKKIEFELFGADLRIDKQIADALASPLVHLTRNAVDHGIEAEADRARLGKANRGHVRIEAAQENERVVIRVSDDGRGIDPEIIAAAATKAGLIDEQTTIDMEESVELIFRQGFSTAESVSTTSGRGVGLDVVENAVQKLGGKVLVRSEVGLGTTVEIVI